MSWETQEENARFVAFGKNKAKENSYVIEEGKTLEGVIEQIKPSDKGYKYIYQLRSKGVEESLIVLGCTDLNNKLGYGNSAVKRVSEGDEVRIKFLGMKPTKKGKEMYTFEVQVKRSG
jgi:hypothetical protein